MTQEALARVAEVPYATLTKIESGAIRNPSLQVVARLAKALGASLDDFLMVETYRGEQAILRIFEDVLATLEDGDEMFITGIEEQRYLETNEAAVLGFIETLKARGIRQKLISCEGDTVRLPGSHIEYRWIPQEYFHPTPIYTYGDKVASIIWGPPIQSVILRNPLLAEAYHKQFLFMWENAQLFKE